MHSDTTRAESVGLHNNDGQMAIVVSCRAVTCCEIPFSPRVSRKCEIECSVRTREWERGAIAVGSGCDHSLRIVVHCDYIGL